MTLKWDINPERLFFVTDESRVIQVVSNLLTNAIKYSREGAVTLVCRKEGSSLEIRVEDEGVGIPESRRADIFKPFIQLESPYTKEHTGMGLGLPISRSIAGGLGGTLDFTSGGEGSCFILTLKEARPIPPLKIGLPDGRQKAEGPGREELSLWSRMIRSTSFSWRIF